MASEPQMQTLESFGVKLVVTQVQGCIDWLEGFEIDVDLNNNAYSEEIHERKYALAKAEPYGSLFKNFLLSYCQSGSFQNKKNKERK